MNLIMHLLYLVTIMFMTIFAGSLLYGVIDNVFLLSFLESDFTQKGLPITGIVFFITSVYLDIKYQ